MIQSVYYRCFPVLSYRWRFVINLLSAYRYQFFAYCRPSLSRIQQAMIAELSLLDQGND
jgi:hypothetical protein